MKLIYFLLSSVLLTSLSGCGGDDCAQEYDGVRYIFELPITLIPKVDTFHLGDTITLRSSFSDNVYDLTSDKTYLLENYDFYPGMNISKIEEIKNGIFLDNFNLYAITTKDYQNLGLHGFAFKYKYENHQYNFEMKFNVKQPGVYIVQIHSALFTMKKDDVDFPGKCKGKIVDALYVMNGNEDDNNFELLKEHMPEGVGKSLFLERKEQHFTNVGGYVFVVVE